MTVVIKLRIKVVMKRRLNAGVERQTIVSIAGVFRRFRGRASVTCKALGNFGP